MTLETVKCVCYTCAETCLKSVAMCAVLLLLRAGSATATAASSIASTMLGITIIALALNNNKWHDRCKCMNKQQCKSEIRSIILCKCWQVMTGNGKWNAIWHGMARYGVLWHVYIIHFERVLGVECVKNAFQNALNMNSIRMYSHCIEIISFFDRKFTFHLIAVDASALIRHNS